MMTSGRWHPVRFRPRRASPPRRRLGVGL